MDKYDVIVNKLSEQIAELSRDRAIFYSLYVTSQEKIKELENELSKQKTEGE